MPSTAILIIDDHPVYRDALGEKFRAEFGSQTPIKLAANTHDGLQIIQSTPAHEWLVVLDILMPGLSGEDAIRALRDQPLVRHVVAISGLDEQDGQQLATRAGASIFISKNNTSQFICDQLRELLDMAVQDFMQAPEPGQEFRLTTRQKEVLTLIACGHPNKIIADQLAISEQTVKIHINQIFRELKVYNRTQAVLKAQKYQLV